MATRAECDKAIRTLIDLLAGVDQQTRAKHLLERTVSVRVTDLDVVWSARLTEDGVQDLTTQDDTRAQVRLSVSSDDLLALVAGELPIGKAVAVGQVRVQASPRDLLRLTSLI